MSDRWVPNWKAWARVSEHWADWAPKRRLGSFVPLRSHGYLHAKRLFETEHQMRLKDEKVQS